VSAHSQLLRDLHPDLHATESGSLFFKWTEAAGKVIQDVSDALDDVQAQLFVVSATDRLTYWEELLDIGTDTTLATAQRRAKIIARLTATGITVQAIKDVTATFIGEEPTVIEWFSRAFRADISAAGDPCIEEDDMFLFEVIVPESVNTASYSHSDLESALEYHKPGHTSLIVTHPEQFELTLTSTNPEDVVRNAPATYGFDVASTRAGRISFTATVTFPAGQEDAITTFSPVSQHFDALTGSGTFDWTPPNVGVATPYSITVEAWGENGGYAAKTYSGTITLS
jgi:uncharacterized protein YmfQ (DUF2313 family)